MNSVIFTAGVVLVWLSSLFNGTGLGNAYHTDRITTAALIGLTVILLLRRRQRTVPKDVFIAFGGPVCIFAMSGILHGTGLGGLQYLCCFLLIISSARSRFRSAPCGYPALRCWRWEWRSS